MNDVRIGGTIQPAEALEALAPWEGAVVTFMTTARDVPLRVTPAPDALARLERAAADACAQGGARVVAWYAEGVVEVGQPIVFLAATARHRKDAQRALDILVAHLKGIARREDVPV